jgi:outer membrane protein assembly factor BamB
VGKNGTVFVGSAIGDIFAISAQGSLLWHFASGELSPVFPRNEALPLTVSEDDTVFCASVQSQIVYVVKNGTLLQRIPSPNVLSPSASLPLIGPDETLYTPATNGFTASFLDEPPKWLAAGLTPVAIDGSGRIFAVGPGFDAGQTAVLDLAGNVLWRLRLRPSTLVIGENGIAFASAGQSTAAILPEGRIAWTRNISGPLAPTADGGVLVAESEWNPEISGAADYKISRLGADGNIFSWTGFRGYGP